MEYLQRCPYKVGGMPLMSEPSTYLDSLALSRESSLGLYGQYWPPLFWYYYYQGYKPPVSPLELGPSYPLSPSLPDPWAPWHTYPGDVTYKRAIDHRESPTKELPTKLLKFDRLKERQELSSMLTYDQDHLNKLNSKRCTGTQTSFAGYVGDRYLPPEAGVRHDSYTLTARSATPHEVRQPSLSPLHRRSPPPAYPHGDTSQNTPLNLSIGENAKLGPLRQILRPSVITCAPGTVGSRAPPSDSPSSLQPAARPDANPASGFYPDIEEHFRRSLGKDYQECISSKSSRSSSPIDPASSPLSVQSDKAVSVTGSVDDHFAKSLGDSTWSQIKAKSESVSFDMFTESVDDHFAKALGDTWLRLKAEKESDSSLPPTCSSPPASPHHHTSIIST